MLPVWTTLLENLVFLMFVSPLVGAGLIVASAGWGRETVRRSALTNAVLTFLLGVLMVVHYDPNAKTESGGPRTYQMVTALRWLAEERLVPSQQAPSSLAAPADFDVEVIGPNVQLAFGVDGISLWLMALTALMMIPAVLSGPVERHQHPAAFYALLLLLESGLIGLFGAIDVVVFAACWEATLLPMLFLLGRWGGFERRRLVRKFFVFQLTGSLFVLAGLIGLVLVVSVLTRATSASSTAATFAVPALTDRLSGLAATADPAVARYWSQESPWIFLCLLLGLVIRLPVVPLHTWLPAANAEAPTALSLLLTGSALSAGGYGIVRFVLPFFSAQCLATAGVLTGLGLLGAVYAALLAVAQDDVKRRAAYASLSQLSLCVVGLFSLNAVAVTGGLLLLIGHGLAFGTISFLIGVRKRWERSQDVGAVSGVTGPHRHWNGLFLVAVFAAVGVPGLSGFAGLTLLLLGVLEGIPGSGGNALGAFVGLLAALLAAAAFITSREWRVERPEAGGPMSDERLGVSGSRLSARWDVSPFEKTVLTVLTALMLGIGLDPQFFISRMQPAVSRTLSAYTATASANDEELNQTRMKQSPVVNTRRGGNEVIGISPHPLVSLSSHCASP